MTCGDRILSNDYYDILVDFKLGEVNKALDLCYVNVEDLYHIVYWNRRQLPDPDDYLYDYRSVPKLYGLMQEPFAPAGFPGVMQEPFAPTGFPGHVQEAFDPTSLIAGGIVQLQREPLSLIGRGCVIVFIDTGIDYTNPLFRNADGSSRILAIWDQTIQTGTPPEGFFYGSEYRREELNRALQSENPYEMVPSRDENGHGSSLAAVAAGRGTVGSDYLGAAPGADIVVVKLKECKDYLREFYMVSKGVPAYEETDIMLAVKYGDGFAENFRRPVVFCIGLGTNYGDHAGSSALSVYLSAVAEKRSRAVVVCGGNEGSAAHHYQGNLKGAGSVGAFRSIEESRSIGVSPNIGEGRSVGKNRDDVEIRVGENCEGFLLEFWGSMPDVYTLSVRSPGGETIPSVRLGISDVITYSFIYERTKIAVAGRIAEPASGEELITLRVAAPTPGIWSFRVESAGGDIRNGEFHMWLPLTQFMKSEVTFLRPSPYITLTEPAMAAGAISVSSYDAYTGSFASFSGRGYTRIGAVKPDLAAPAVNIPVIFGRQSGSSLGAAIAAGAAAQFLQWAVVDGNNVTAGRREIRNFFLRGAERSMDLDYPNREWGYGELNLEGTFNALIGV